MLILALHQFDNDQKSAPYYTSKKYLLHIVNTLGSEKCVSLNQSTIEKPEKKTWAITVDDGYSSDLKLWDFCQTLEIPLTCFINTDNLGKSGFLKPKDLVNLSRGGAIIASHSNRHVDLTVLPKKQLTDELRSSKEKLEDITSQEISLLAYPWGRNNFYVRAATRNAGYSHAFSTTPRSVSADSPNFCLPRFALFEDARIDSTHLKTFSTLNHAAREPLRLYKSFARKITNV